MDLERLDRGHRRLILICVAVAAVSLFIGVKYYFLAFPEASIEFRVTRESSVPVAESFLQRLGLDLSSYHHAAVFGFDDQQKTFLERELGVEETNKLLATTVRLWRWKHRWFRPLHKEEASVDVTTKGEVVGFHHLLPEDAAGADLPVEDARAVAERFLAGTMGRPLDTLSFVEASSQKRPHRTDHSFTWKVTGSEVKGADYRVGVDVAGANVAGYSEKLKVPDTWVRGYEKLRSRNQAAGQIDSVLLFLTVLAMLVVLGLRIRRSDVRWRPAAILGGTMFLLMTLSQLNSLPSSLYGYDTATSYGGFLLTTLLLALGAGLLSGVGIFLLTASGETLYRQRFPSSLSLSSLLRLRALRSRELFIASLVGVTLTCFFFAYENVFYLIANSLGAWAPRDVAYSDLLSTWLPWVYVLFFGFFPAISEEFISRMFSIPFFEKIFKSTAVAIIVAAFIWGFGHAAYPNQPFWIRGLEVGLAGIVFGLILLRFGIAAVVICHFSVDALYTAFPLIRSPDLYYRISGGLSAGVWLLVLLGAAIAYWHKGGFLPAKGTNQEEGVAPPPEERPAVAEVVAAQETAYRPLAGRRLAVGLAVASALVALGFLPVQRFGDWVAIGATRAKARATAAAFLKANGFDVSAYRSAVESPLTDRTDPTAAAYLLDTGGLEVADEVYQNLAPTPLWRVRFFIPGQKEEYWVSVDATTDTAVGFSRSLLDETPGATISSEDALELARSFLLAHGIDPSAGELKEQKQKDEKARRDYTLVWELPVEDGGEAKIRQEIVVQGDAVGSWLREVKIPEEWRREREKQTVLTVVLKWLKLPLIAAFAALALVLLVGRLRAGEVPWRFALVTGGVASAVTLVRVGLSLDVFWARYQTSVPAGLYLVFIAVGLFMAAVGTFVVGAVTAGLAGALYPRAVGMLRRSARSAFGRDALVAGGLGVGLALGVPTLIDLLRAAIPSGRLIEGVSWPSGIESASPLLYVLCGALFRVIVFSALAAIVVAVLARYFKGRLGRWLLALLVVLSFLPLEARTPAEYLVAALSLVIAGGAALLLILLFLRDNPLAWASSVWFGLGGGAAVRYLEQPAASCRLTGALILAVLLASVLWLALSRRRTAPAPPSALASG